MLTAAHTTVGKQLVRRLVDEVVNAEDMRVLEEIYTEPMARARLGGSPKELLRATGAG